MLKPIERGSLCFRAISLTLAAVFLASVLLSDFPRLAYAQGEQVLSAPAPVSVASSLNLPSPNKLIELSPKYQPVSLRGLRFYPDDPLRFDFLVDKPEGDGAASDSRSHRPSPNLLEDGLKNESSQLIKYFLASLTIPEEDLWVNLSPYEADKVVPDELGLTEMGKDLLAQDYLLKQLMASLTYPENPLGKEFWDKAYKQAYQLFGTSKIPINTFNKVWIVPDKAVVYEDKDRVILGESRLKVMLEEDYLAFKNRQRTEHREQRTEKIKLTEKDEQNINNFSSSIMQEVILPQIEQEVNEGKNFSQLRQIYHSLILATWFKQKLKTQINADIEKPQIGADENQTTDEPILSKLYIDKKKIKGVDSDDPKVKEKVYSLYLEAYKNGLYNYIKKDLDPYEKKQIKRRYYSGGLDATAVSSVIIPRSISQMSNPVFSSSSSLSIQLTPSISSSPTASIPTAHKEEVSGSSSPEQQSLETAASSSIKIDWHGFEEELQIYQKDPNINIFKITQDLNKTRQWVEAAISAGLIGRDLKIIYGIEAREIDVSKPVRLERTTTLGANKRVYKLTVSTSQGEKKIAILVARGHERYNLQPSGNLEKVKKLEGDFNLKKITYEILQGDDKLRVPKPGSSYRVIGDRFGLIITEEWIDAEIPDVIDWNYKNDIPRDEFNEVRKEIVTTYFKIFKAIREYSAVGDGHYRDHFFPVDFQSGNVLIRNINGRRIGALVDFSDIIRAPVNPAAEYMFPSNILSRFAEDNILFGPGENIPLFVLEGVVEGMGINEAIKFFNTALLDPSGIILYPKAAESIRDFLKKIIPVVPSSALEQLPPETNVSSSMLEKKPLCLTPDSLITLADGTQKPLIELKPFSDLRGRTGMVGDGDVVLTLNEQTGKLEPHRVLALLDMGVKPVYRITTASGKTLKTTLTHPYLTKNGWRKLRDIKVGDEISVIKEAVNYSRQSRDPDTASGQPSTIGYGAGEETVAAGNLDKFSQFLNSPLNNSGGNKEITLTLKKKQGLFGSFEREPSFLKGISNNSYCAVDFQFQTLRSGSGSQIISKNYRLAESRSKIEDIFFSFLKPEFSYYPFNIGNRPFLGRDYFEVFPEANLLRKAVVTKTDFRDDAYRDIERWEFMQEGYFFNLLKMDKWSSVNDDFLHPWLPIVYLSEPPYPDAQSVLLYQGLPAGLPYAGKSAFLGTGTIWNSATSSLIQSLQPRQLLPQGSYAGNAQFLSVVQLLKLAFKSSLSYFKNNINYFFCQGLILDAYASSFDLVKQDNSQGILWDKIISIEPLGPMQVYDIEVEATHNFIAQGIVAHNTYSQWGEEKTVSSGITKTILEETIKKYANDWKSLGEGIINDGKEILEVLEKYKVLQENNIEEVKSLFDFINKNEESNFPSAFESLKELSKIGAITADNIKDIKELFGIIIKRRDLDWKRRRVAGNEIYKSLTEFARKNKKKSRNVKFLIFIAKTSLFYTDDIILFVNYFLEHFLGFLDNLELFQIGLNKKSIELLFSETKDDYELTRSLIKAIITVGFLNKKAEEFKKAIWTPKFLSANLKNIDDYEPLFLTVLDFYLRYLYLGYSPGDFKKIKNDQNWKRFIENIKRRKGELGPSSISELYLVYQNVNFKRETEGLSSANQFSVAMAIGHTLERFELSVSDENINQVLPFIMRARKSHGKDIILDENSRLVIVSYPDSKDKEERAQEISKISQFSRQFGVKEENINILSGKNAKVEDVLQAIQDTQNTTFWFSGHGNPLFINLGKGTLIGYQELADALIRRAQNNNGRLSDLSIIIDACYSADFIVKVLNSLFPVIKSRDLPVVVVSTSRGAIAYGHTFIDSLRINKDKTTRLTLEQFYQAEEEAADKQDFTLFLPISEEEFEELKKGLKLYVQPKEAGNGYIILETSEFQSRHLNPTLPILEAQIGKGAFVDWETFNRIEQAVQIKDVNTQQRLGRLTLQQNKDINPIEVVRSAIDKTNFREGHKQLLLAIVDGLTKSPPAFYVFRTLYKDLLGFASVKHNLIAIHQDFANEPTALFHELAEYLIQSEALSLKLKKPLLVITTKEKQFTLSLQEEALSIADRGPESPHYLLRALQKEIFKGKDENLTQKIKSTQPLCLTPDSLITLADGSQKPLIALKPLLTYEVNRGKEEGDMVLSLNEQTGKLEPHRVLALLDMGVKPVYRITTASGKTLKTTLTHPYRTPDGWKKLKDIKVGDKISVLQEAINYGAGEEVAVAKLEGLTSISLTPKFNTFHKNSFTRDIKGEAISADAKAVGAGRQVDQGFSSDKRVIQRGIISKFFINSYLNFLMQRFEIALPSWCKLNGIHKQGYAKPSSCSIFSKGIQPFFLASAIESLRERIKSGLRGSFDSILSISHPAGFTDSLWYSSVDNLSTNASSILESTSRSATVSKIKSCGSPFLSTITAALEPLLSLNTEAGAILLKAMSFADFNFVGNVFIQNKFIIPKYNLSRLFLGRAEAAQVPDVSTNSDILWDKIISIDYLGNLPVYDIEVEATHNFIAQGIVAHNTYTERKPETSNQKPKKIASSSVAAELRKKFDNSPDGFLSFCEALIGVIANDRKRKLGTPDIAVPIRELITILDSAKDYFSENSQRLINVLGKLFALEHPIIYLVITPSSTSFLDLIRKIAAKYPNNDYGPILEAMRFQIMKLREWEMKQKNYAPISPDSLALENLLTKFIKELPHKRQEDGDKDKGIRSLLIKTKLSNTNLLAYLPLIRKPTLTEQKLIETLKQLEKLESENSERVEKTEEINRGIVYLKTEIKKSEGYIKEQQKYLSGLEEKTAEPSQLYRPTPTGDYARTTREEEFRVSIAGTQVNLEAAESYLKELREKLKSFENLLGKEQPINDDNIRKKRDELDKLKEGLRQEIILSSNQTRTVSSAVRITYEDLAQVPDVKSRAQAIIDEMKNKHGQPYETKTIDIEGKKIEVINWFRALGAEEWQAIQDVLGKFRSIAGEKFLEEIYYLAIEPMDKPNPNAPSEKMNGYGAVDGVFKLFPNAFNQKEHRVSGVSNLSGSVIHELGHTVADILVNAWLKEFPENGNSRDYITPYAKTNAKEDITETMVAVIYGIDYFQQPIVQKKIEFLQNALKINTEDNQPLCLTPDSLITLADGSQKPLIALKPLLTYEVNRGKEEGDMVLSLNEQTGKLEPHRVLALLDMGVKPVYRITTASGKTLKTTLTHPYLTKNGWRKLKDIKVGDEIRVVGVYSYARFTDISDGRGDGLRGSGRRELLPRALNQWLKQLKDWLTPQSSFAGQIITPIAPTAVINSQEVTLIPKETFKKSEAILPANQSGKTPPIKVWDTKRLLSVVQKSIFSINLPHFGNKKYTTSSRSSQENLRTIFEPIISIDYLGNLPVYDIEVEATHNFLAQGIVAHNTYLRKRTENGGQRTEEAGSPAVVAEKNKGGIDLNPQNLNLEVIGEAKGDYPQPFNPIPLDLQNFQGFSFQIISVRSADSWEAALGLSSQETAALVS